MDPKKFKRNRTAQAGDSLILSKPIGIGILSAAFKQEKISEKAYAKMIDYTTQLNTPGMKFAQMCEVHALTDVTGFGLAGHLLEMTRGAKLQAQLQFDQIPFIDEALDYVKENIFTGASTRNWQGYSDQITSQNELFIWQKHLLSDPQTSGGLLIACDPVAEKEVLKTLHQDGFITAQKIGYLKEGSGIVVS